MSKKDNFYLCNNCGNEFSRWSGQCPLCKEWNSLKELKITESANLKTKGEKSECVSAFSSVSSERFKTNIKEFDRVLGGGFFPDEFVLLTGDPGVGKSTLALQSAMSLSVQMPLIYFSGEESVSQVSDRVNRLNSKEKKLNLKIAAENSLENIIATIEQEDCKIVVIDSIQTISSATLPAVAGSLSQVRFCTETLMHFLKKKKIACLLIGHVNKSGDFAGPQTLAHLVDCVLFLEGDKYHQFRILRGQKNRFGSTAEIGIFEMIEAGLKEVENPSQSFLEGRLENAEGSVIIPTIEGTRPFLVELQALTSWTNFGYPKRTASGIDINRLALMIAVLQKHGKQKLENLYIFVNIVGGFKIAEHSADLGLLLAIASSKLKKNLDPATVVFGEVGLSGEIRRVPQTEKRLKEAEKLGFKQAIIPKGGKPEKSALKIIYLKSINEALNVLTK